MLQEPFIFLLVLMSSLILKNFIFSNRTPELISKIFNYFFIVGVVFHELAHAVMILVGGRVPKKIRIKWYDRTQRTNPHGWVEPDGHYSFLHTVLISFAPVFISTWLMWFLWEVVIFTPFHDVLIKTGAVYLFISLWITAAPSGPDIRFIPAMYSKDPRHSWYQILLITVSVLVLWLYLVVSQMTFILDFFYYLAIAGIYFSLRFSLIGFKKIFIKVDSYNFKKPQKVHARSFTRKRYKPTKPWKDQGGN